MDLCDLCHDEFMERELTLTGNQLLCEKCRNESRNGWLTPHGKFIPADETPAVRMAGLELGGHAKAALEHLMKHHLDLYDDLRKQRAIAGYMTWEECEPLIKDFMERHGFKRIADY